MKPNIFPSRGRCCVRVCVRTTIYLWNQTDGNWGIHFEIVETTDSKRRRRSRSRRRLRKLKSFKHDVAVVVAEVDDDSVYWKAIAKAQKRETIKRRTQRTGMRSNTHAGARDYTDSRTLSRHSSYAPLGYGVQCSSFHLNWWTAESIIQSKGSPMVYRSLNGQQEMAERG